MPHDIAAFPVQHSLMRETVTLSLFDKLKAFASAPYTTERTFWIYQRAMSRLIEAELARVAGEA